MPAQLKSVQETILSKYVMLTINLGLPPNMKGIKPAEINIEGKLRKRVAAQKRLLESKEFNAVVNYDEAIRSAVKPYMLRCTLGRGSYAISVEDVTEVDKLLDEMFTERGRLADIAAETRATYIAEAEKELGVLFNPKDYISKEAFRARFTASKMLSTFETPETLKGVNPDLYEKTKKEAERMWKARVEEMNENMTAMFSGVITHLAEQLGVKEDGKRKILRQSAVEQVMEFVNSFSKFNVGNYKELEKLVAEAKKLVEGVDVQDIRTDKAFRDVTLLNLLKVQTGLDKLMTEAPTRKIRVRKGE